MLQNAIWPPRDAGRIYGLVLSASLAFASGLACAQPAAVPAEPLPNRATMEAGGLEIRDVTLATANAARVHIGRGVFFGLQHGEGVVRAERVVLERIRRSGGQRQIVLPELTLRGVVLPVDLFRALTEGAASPFDWMALVERTTAGEIGIPAIAEDDSAAGTRLALRNIALQGLEGGRIARARIEQIAGETPGGSGPAFKTGAVTAQGVNLAELVRFATGGSEGAAVPLLENLAVAGFTLTTADSEASIETLELAGLIGSAPASSPKAPQASRITLPGQPDPEETNAGRHFRALLRNSRLDRFALSGIQLRSPDFGALAIATVSLSALSGNGIEKIEIAGTELSGSALDMKLERLTLEKLVYGEFLSRTLDALTGPGQIGLLPERFAESPPQLSLLRLSGLALDTPAGPLTLANISMESDPPDPAVIPKRLTVNINGLSLDLEKGAQAFGPTNLLRLGYRQLKADGRIQLRSIAGERALVMDDTRFAVAEMGSVDLAMRLGNFDLAAAVSNPQLSDEILDATQIESIELRAADAGLADRFYAQLARDTGLPEDMLRTASAQEMKGHAAHFFTGALAPGAADALATFIRKPGRLVIRAVPKPGQPPLKLSDLDQLSPPELNARITISIEAAAN